MTTGSKIQRVSQISPWNDWNGVMNDRIIGPPKNVKRKKNKSSLSQYNDARAHNDYLRSTTSIIVESLLLGQPDDMTLLPDGSRIDRTGFLL